MKYYFPTTTLNLPSILATESISPKAFYGMRGYGSSRWHTLSANGPDDRIILYSDARGFSIPEDGLDERLLLLEIETSEKFEKIADGAFQCVHTICLDPTSTRFIFVSADDVRSAWTLCGVRLESKLMRLYGNCCFVGRLEGAYDVLPPLPPVSVKEGFVNNDCRKNRLKGLLYGYYIGSLLSTDATSLKKLNCLNEIRDIFSAVSNSPDRLPTALQRGRLDALFGELIRLHPHALKLKKVFGEEISLRVLEIENEDGVGIQSPCNRLLGNVRVNNAQPVEEWISGMLQKVHEWIESNRKAVLPSAAEIVIDESDVPDVNESVVSNPKSRALFKKWTNGVLVDRELSGKISARRERLADALTYAAKDVLGTGWNGSYESDFLNDLRDYIGGGTFDHEWKNDVLCSMAAVLLKGDEWEELLTFLQRKGLTDYRLAFAFFGELKGFSNLEKSFTDILFSRDEQYVKSVYAEIHGQTVRHCIEWTAVPLLEVGQCPKAGLKDEARIKSLSTESDGMLKSKVLRFFDEVVLKECKSLKKGAADALRRSLLCVLDQMGGSQSGNQLVSMLRKQVGDGWATAKKETKALGLMRKEFAPELSKPSRKDQPEFDFAKRDSVLTDRSWIVKCSGLIMDLKAKSRFEHDAEWFLGQYSDVYDDGHQVREGRYKDLPKDNASIIGNLERYMKGRSRPYPGYPQIPADYVKIPVDEIVRQLRGLYA